MYHKSLGIILNKESISESDKILQIYTSELGRITAVSKGAKRLHAKMLTATEPITETDFMFYSASSNAMPKIVGGELKNQFTALKNNLKRYTIACRTAEIVNTLTARYDRNPDEYILLKRTLELLESAKNPKRIYMAFVLRFLKLCGYAPQLSKCIRCGGKHHAKTNIIAMFSLKDKGILCKNCSEKTASGAFKLDADTLSYIRKLARLSGEEVDKLEPAESMDVSVSEIIELYMQEFLPYQLKTQEFLNTHAGMGGRIT